MATLVTATLPGHFEALLEADPFAAAVVLLRDGRRTRVWVRAAVEHRAARVGALCARRGLPAHARVAIAAGGALDVMGCLWFVLSSGRQLAPAAEADLVLDDAALRGVELGAGCYTLRCTVGPADAAAILGGRVLTHAQLFERVQAGGAPTGDRLIDRALRALVVGEPLLVEAESVEDARAAVYAA